MADGGLSSSDPGNPYKVRLEDLGPPPDERTTSTEYVAEHFNKRPSPYTIEGMLDGFGQLSAAAVDEPESPRGRRARTMVLLLLAPFVVGGLLQLLAVLGVF